jgi:hypothetical protein
MGIKKGALIRCTYLMLKVVFTFTYSKGKVPVLFFNEHHVLKEYSRNGIIAPRILDLGTEWR